MATGFTLLVIITLAILFVIISSAKFKLHPFLSLILAALFTGLAAGMPVGQIVPAITRGFGEMTGQIGLVIVLGSLIGVFLEKSGAALSIALKMLSLAGSRYSTAMMSLTGGLVGIPVFCDSAFIVLHAPGRQLARQSQTNPAAVSLATATGLYATHVLVPPTPGPLAAAGNLGAADRLGWVIGLGILLSIPAVITGLWWSVRVSKTIHPISPAPEHNPEEPVNRLPVFWKSALPILLPLLLILLGSVSGQLTGHRRIAGILQFLGNANIALLTGLLAAFTLFHKQYKSQLAKWTEQAILQAGPILLITAAGGAFGGVLRVLPLGDWIENLLAGHETQSMGLLPVLYLLAAALKTTQGSSTAAMVIVSSLVAPLLPALQIHSPLALSLLVMTIGAGAMTVSHTNDSYFWVISRFSGMTLKETLKGFTVASFIQGVTVLLASMLIWGLLVEN
jgi:GntP family gluconate:H+ symporter